MPTISACIVAYCDYEEVCAAVRSILHFTPAPDFTLYIVDNASPDGCGKQLADTDWADPRVQVLCLPENVGFGRGHNAVLGKLHSSVHFILNPDIVLTGDILQPMEMCIRDSGGPMLVFSCENRMGTPEELGFAIATLADERNGYLAGVDILCDGGTIRGMHEFKKPQ